jgi:ribonucleoside-diphosphate reductase alpha chain
VKKIEDSFSEVYDIEVENTHSYLVDNIISHNTINLPQDAKEEDIAKVYLEAHKLGIIGVTVYRDKCREGILSAERVEEVNKIVKTQAPKRPESLPCDIHHVKITKKLDKIRNLEYIVGVGLLYGDPYEIFVFENGRLDKEHTNGVLVKRARGKYDIVLASGYTVDNIMREQTEEEECITRMASTALRHGADIGFIVHQLEKVKGDVGAFTKVMARVLKKYIHDGVKVSGEQCPQCVKKDKKGELVRECGCITCKECGWSKC